MSRQTLHSWFSSHSRPLRRQGQRSPSTGGYFRRLRLEPLEDRRMLALLMVNSDLDNTIGGDGLVTLREAIDAANAPGTATDLGDVSDPGHDAIEFDPGLDGSTILLDNLLGEMPIIEDLTIDAGSLVVGLRIDAGHGFDGLPGTFDGVRIFNVDDFLPGPGAIVEMIGLTLTGGDVLGDGGAILNFEDLILTEVTITENAADGLGGGISNAGVLTLDLCEVSDNTAEFFGGGINSIFGDLEINRSTISGNEVTSGSGGGVYAYTYAGHILSVTDSTISGNLASVDGGGLSLYTALGAVSEITNSTVSGNEADGFGGGVFNYTDPASLTLIAHSTITGNTSDADFDGFGAGGGMYTFGVGVPTVDHTIVAVNFGGALPPTDIMGAVAGVYNLIGVDTGLIGIVHLVGGNMVGTAAVPIDPMLAPLQNNGGPTETHRLMAGSPPHDAGFPLYVGPPFEDQRGAPFAREDFATMLIDIGAYELQDVGAPMALVVDTLADENDGLYVPGDLSLREAIGLANGNYGLFDTIEFDPALAGQTIVLTKGEIGIRDDVLIDAGALVAPVTIESFDPSPAAGDGSRIFVVDDGDFATVIGVTIVGLALVGGDVDGAGGAIFSVEDLFLTDCYISGNAALADGGGVFSIDGLLDIHRSTLSGNTSGGSGGGLFAATGPIASVMIHDSTISGNSAALDGGGIEVLNFSVLGALISNSTISGNEADGSGGGVFADTAFGYSTTIEHSTITANICNDDGVGAETGGGTLAAGGGTFEIVHTIVAQNFDGTGLDDDLDGMTFASFSLVGIDTTGTVVNVLGSSLIGLGIPIDPVLGPLANNGGPTLTHALLPGSPALDAGDPLFAGLPLEDQRGAPFARVDAFGPSVIDIGAYERQDIGGPMVWVVDTLVDWSDGDYSLGNLSLREAIGLANGNIGFDDVIEFDLSLSGGLISLSRLLGELAISDGVRIDAGPLAAGLTIEAFDPTPGVKNGDGTRIFNIDDGDPGPFIDVELVGLSLTGGDVATSGGGIRNFETLTITDCIVSDNATFGGGAFGGGIYNFVGVLTINGSTISNNSVSGVVSLGGGIGSDGDLFIYDSKISENAVLSGPAAGGGIWAGASLTLIRSTVADNFTLGASTAGGIDATAGGGTLTIESSTISGNSTTGDGGGIRIAVDIFSIQSSTISGNSADGNGGGIFLATPAANISTISHTTITDNTADADAGGGQAGGGIGMTGPLLGTVELDHTIVAANMDSSGSAPDVKTVIVIGILEASYSLIGEDTGATITDVVGNQIGTSGSPIDPELEPLAFNGGPTKTHELKSTSPALDAGDPDFLFPPFFDQRGVPYTRDYDGDGVGGSQIDIGAFELQTLGTPPALFGDYNHNGTVDAADYAVWRDTEGNSVTPYTGADGSGNGIIDENDWIVWRANFGAVLGAGAGSGAATESASDDEQPASTTTAEPVAAEPVAVAVTVEAAPVVSVAATSREQAVEAALADVPETDGHHSMHARKSESSRHFRHGTRTKRIASDELLLACMESWGDDSSSQTSSGQTDTDGDADDCRTKRWCDDSSGNDGSSENLDGAKDHRHGKRWDGDSTGDCADETDLAFETLGSGAKRLY